MAGNKHKPAVLKGFSRYQVYGDGRILNIVTGKFMRIHDDGKNGYRKVKLTDDKGTRIHWWLNRLVYAAFFGPIPKRMEIDHSDGDRLNNSIGNLILVTHEQNCRLKQQRDNKTLFNRKAPAKKKKLDR